MYAFYYVQEAGVKTPWCNPLVKIRAAGDDVVILCHPSLCEQISASIYRLSSRQKRSE